MNNDELRALAQGAQLGSSWVAIEAFRKAASPDRIIDLLDDYDSLVDDLTSANLSAGEEARRANAAEADLARGRA